MSRPVGGVEAGGTKWVCAIGTGPDDITANNTENYVTVFPYLGPPHSGYNAHTSAALAG